MKQLNITIHPFSALAGMALLGLVWVTAGAMPLQGSSSTRDVSAIENVNEPHPRDFVRVIEGTPYTVPQGKLLVIKQMGYVCHVGGSTNPDVELVSNGACIASTSSWWLGAADAPTYDPGLSIQPGSIVQVKQDSSAPKYNAAAIGYLVDA